MILLDASPPCDFERMERRKIIKIAQSLSSTSAMQKKLALILVPYAEKVYITHLSP